MYTEPFPAGGEYKADFVLSLVGGSHGAGGEFDIDDVVITRQPVAVDPTSLGQVRALFR